MEWQPIETAPKDETGILVVSGGVVGEANYKDYDGYEPGWFWINTYPQDSDPIDPTHWMPLPDPPSGDQGRG